MGVAGHDRVKVYRGNQAVLHQQVALNAVNDIMAVHDIILGIHFQMEADQSAAGAVIVDHQIVYAQHTGVTQRLFFDMLDQLRVGCRTEQRIDGIAHKCSAAVQDERCHTKAHQTVQTGKTGQLCQHCGSKNRGCGDDIVAGISGGGQQGLRLDVRADFVVEPCHPELDKDGGRQHRDHDPVEVHGRGVQHLCKALLQQLNADDEDHDRNGQPGQILIPGVTVGML